MSVQLAASSVDWPAGLRRLRRAVPRSGVALEARRALKQWLGDLGRELEYAFRCGAAAGALARQRARALDHLLAHVWHACLGEPAGLALFAVGGYGRGLLFPASDLDLLVLNEVPEAARQRALEQFLAILWDLGLKLGHAVRDFEQCQALAAQDLNVFTSLLDTRQLAGPAHLAQRLTALVDDSSLWPPQAFLDARLAERDRRHARFGGTAYNLEPNLKDGPGGLRSLDALRWLGARLLGAAQLDALAAQGVLDFGERDTLLAAESLLQRYRFALHLEAGRAEERLLFDYQRALARRLGFEDEHAGNLGVEQFMQGYFRAATQIERLGAQLLERFEEMLEPAAAVATLDADFERHGMRLAIREHDLFLRRPAALVDIFGRLLDDPTLRGFSAHTMRRMQQALAQSGASLATDPSVLRALLGLLRRGAPAVAALCRMNRCGLLAEILPPFARVFGRMQYDLFHVYTVDEHTMRVLANIARFDDPAARGEFALGCEIWPRLAKPELLLLAALFHDIAKGRGGDHSLLGEEEARAFCQRLQLPEEEGELVAWLVRWHLLMSATAQRKDITDPQVVRRFAEEIIDWEHLDHLYLLTVADIIGTNPKLWNSWKDRLLSDLYTAARYVLRSGGEAILHAEARSRASRELTRQTLRQQGFADALIETVWADIPAAFFLRSRSAQAARQAAAILRADGELPVVDVDPWSSHGCTELFFYAADREGLFATVTAALDRMRFSVQEARVLSSPAGRALDIFFLLDADSQAPANAERSAELAEHISQLLRQQRRVQPAKRGLSRQLKHFQAPARIVFGSAQGRTQLSLVCTDRPGLLAAVAEAMAEAGVHVHDARIATFGERVEDFFMLTDAEAQALNFEARERLLDAILGRIGERQRIRKTGID